MYGTLTALFLESMLVLRSDKTYSAMTNYDVGDNDGNKDNNAASGSGSYGPILALIIMPRSRGGGSENNRDRNYGRGTLYPQPAGGVPNDTHKHSAEICML